MASPEVFVDTSGLYALVDKNDAHHEKARTAVEELARAGRKLVLTDYVIDEAATLAKARSGRRVAMRVLDLPEQSEGIRIEWIGSSRFEEAKTFFRKHADHGYSFTDCSSFVVMFELELIEALTTDKHFAEAGFEVLLA
ncbi:MAG TPA: PIN domain-containing protein [Woeseiaceae bacterium]|nr:PIN domain-containing protein [Woeseiaceae bacterium]